MTITEFIRRNGMIVRGDRVLCAVSGGADSVCLLRLLSEAADELGITVFAAHYEHGIRGEESLRDAAFTESLCGEMKIPCTIGHGDVPDYARQHGLGLEEAAREMRYAFLEQTADRLGCSRIATAHNADDNAETVLFHLCRGTGTAGMCGIPPVRGRIIRPLLFMTRQEIEETLNQYGLKHVEDSSNASDDYTRNRIRHSVMPVLRELNPSIGAAVLRQTELTRADEVCLQKQADAFITRYYDGSSLPVKELALTDRAIASRVLRALCPQTLSMKHTEALLGLLEGSGIAALDLPGLRVRREQGRIYFSESAGGRITSRILMPGQSLSLDYPACRISCKIENYTEEINGLFKTYFFKSDNICGNITVTGRLPGDRMRPKGRKCSKTLKQLFTEKKMTQEERDATIILRDDRHILAAVGLAVDESTIPQAGDRIYKITIE